MGNLTRFGMSLDDNLLKEFDNLIRDKKYQNRSEAIRDLIRAALIQSECEKDEAEIVGTVTLIYNHHEHESSEKLTSLQHVHHHQILSTMHIHLDHDNCLEVLAVRGKAKDVRHIADELIGQKGVRHGKLVTTLSGKNLK